MKNSIKMLWENLTREQNGLSKWGQDIYKLLLTEDEDKFKINIEKELKLPFPMLDGKDKLEPGEYEVELSTDKENYVWTNPETNERVSFPFDSIKEEEPEEATAPPVDAELTGTAPATPETQNPMDLSLPF